MTRWDYQVAVEEDGMFLWDDGSGNEKRLALVSGLRLLGAKGYELVTTIERKRFGGATSHTLIFKKFIEG